MSIVVKLIGGPSQGKEFILCKWPEDAVGSWIRVVAPVVTAAPVEGFYPYEVGSYKDDNYAVQRIRFSNKIHWVATHGHLWSLDEIFSHLLEVMLNEEDKSRCICGAFRKR